MSGSIRIGLVGCGRLAELGYVPASRLAADATIVAVADPEADRRRAVAELAGPAVEAHPDAASLLAAGDIDAVVLATPAAHHLADAERAVEAGVPVLVEKPPAPDALGALALVDLGPTVHVGFNRRFDPAIAAVRSSMPPAGPLDLHLSIAYRRASWSAHTVRDDVLLDLVPHLVDLARWLTGSDVSSVSASELHADRAVLSLGLGRGRATVVAAADRLHDERVEVRDADGTVVARHRTGGAIGAVTGRALALADRARGRSRPHPLAASLAAQLDAFAAAVRGHHAPDLASAADGLAAMSVVDAARTSGAAGGAPVPITALREPTC